MKHYQNYINGQWVDGGAGRLEIEAPATGEVFATHAMADAGDVDAAVLAASRMHSTGVLTDMRPIALGRMVQAMGRYFTDHCEEIAAELAQETGKPFWEALIETDGAALYFEYYGNQASTVEGRSIPLGAGYFDFTVNVPLGVSAQIIPWNYPLEMTARSLSAALATGNTCVIKTPELAPIAARHFAFAAEAAGFVAGVVNILCGAGAVAGAALAGHDGINQVVFTGSVATGRAVAIAAAANIVPCVLELGGKSAAIIRADADMDAVMDSVRWGIYFNSGQVCSAMSRAVVHESRHDEFVSRAAEVARGLEIGTGEGHMGAMISSGQRDRAAALVTRAIEQGCKVAVGGHAPNRAGAFYIPTVLADVTPDMEIAREEIFGPVLSVMPYVDDTEAVRIANGTDYGLVAGIFTKDVDYAMHAAAKLRAGQVFVNEWFAGGVETPFGGFGKSGYGREKGREALWNYVQTKNVAVSYK